MIFKMLVLEQLAEKWHFSARESSNRSEPPPSPLAMGLSYQKPSTLSLCENNASAEIVPCHS